MTNINYPPGAGTGTGLDYINIRSVGLGEKKKDIFRIQLSGNQRINRTYRVSTGDNEKQRRLQIYYRREFTDDDLLKWKLKRNTG